MPSPSIKSITIEPASSTCPSASTSGWPRCFCTDPACDTFWLSARPVALPTLTRASQSVKVGARSRRRSATRGLRSRPHPVPRVRGQHHQCGFGTFWSEMNVDAAGFLCTVGEGSTKCKKTCGPRSLPLVRAVHNTPPSPPLPPVLRGLTYIRPHPTHPSPPTPSTAANLQPRTSSPLTLPPNPDPGLTDEAASLEAGRRQGLWRL